MNGTGIIVVSAILAGALTTWDAIRDGESPPDPRRYSAVVLLYGAIALIGAAAPELAAILAGAFTFGLFLSVSESGVLRRA